MSTWWILVLYGHGEVEGGQAPRKGIYLQEMCCPGINSDNSLPPSGN